MISRNFFHLSLRGQSQHKRRTAHDNRTFGPHFTKQNSGIGTGTSSAMMFANQGDE
jgi:hypothetical protein